jgi:hypothetical protein
MRLFHAVRIVERFNDLWLLSGVHDLWKICRKLKKKILKCQDNVIDMVYCLGVYELCLTEAIALVDDELGLTEDVDWVFTEDVDLGVSELGLTEDVDLGV